MKIGELFVDLDFREGGAINKLTNFSIKFLALKTMATQVADTFDSMFGSVIDGVVAFENLNDTTGISVERMQKWKALAEQNNVSFEDLISSLKNLQSASADIMLGKGNSAPFTQLGIDMTRPREAFGLLNEIRARIMEINDVGLRRNLLQEMGVSENMLILFKNFNGYYDENLQLTKEERDSVMELNKEWTALKQTFGMGWDKVFAQGAEGATKLIKAIREITSEYSNLIAKSDNLGEALVKIFEDIAKSLKEMAEDNKFISILSSLTDAVHTFGSWIGTGIAYAVDFANQGLEWADKRHEEAVKRGEVQKRVPLIDLKKDPNRMENPFYREVLATPEEKEEYKRKKQENNEPVSNTFVNEIMASPEQIEQNISRDNIVNSGGNIQDGRTINVNNYITSSKPVDRTMMEDVGNTTAQQIGNLGYMSGR